MWGTSDLDFTALFVRAGAAFFFAAAFAIAQASVCEKAAPIYRRGFMSS